MRIDLGFGGYMEPGERLVDPRWRKRIMKTERVENTRSGHWCDLECGHRVMAFGNLDFAEGEMACLQCRDQETR
ncbi:MAG TPA: hypothetical protein VGG62_12215 [Terracidiphilus sp.]